MIKEHRSHLILAALPLAEAAVLLTVSYLCQAATGRSHTAENILTVCSYVMLATFVIMFAAAYIRRRRDEDSDPPGRQFWYIFYTAVSTWAVSGITSGLAKYDPLKGVVKFFLMIYGFVFFIFVVIFAVNRMQYANSVRSVTVKEILKEEHKKNFVERCGSDEVLEIKYIYAELGEKKLDEFIHLLCGVKPSALKSENGEKPESSELPTIIEERGLLLGECVHAARHPEQLRMMFDRLCRNRGFNARISQKELAEEMERCDDEHIKLRRREGTSTWEHDMNLITHILNRQGFTIVFFDADPFEDCYAVIRTTKLERLEKLADM